jgi:hypothetical protein
MRPTAPITALILTSAALALAACGSDDEKKSSAAQTVTKVVTQARTETQTRVERSVIVLERVKELTGFSSPSKNIGCYIDKTSVRCDIRDRTWKPSARPANCDLDFGQGIGLGAGRKARFVCAGDTALGPPKRLAYGAAIQAGVLRCDSARAGMTCRDTKTGRGFFLSRQSYRIF